MGRRASLGLILAALAAAPGGSAAAQPPGPPAVPPELQPYVPRTLGAYFVGFLVAPAEPRPMSRELFIRHQAYLRRQFEAGVYRLAGPLTDDGHIHGVVILSAPSREAALAIVAADPSVQEGVFAVELHPAMFPDLSALRVEYPPPPN
jgi:uncharacterized protein YciI